MSILAGVTRQLTANEQLPPAPPGSPALPSTNFTIFIRGVPVGTEQVALTRSADGWTVVSSGRMGPPVELVSRRVEARYSADWKPVELVIDASIRGVARSLHTTIAGTTATNEISVGGAPSRKTDTIDSDAVLLPDPFFGPYQALAMRLRTVQQGATVPAYVPPQYSLSIRVGETAPEQIQTPGSQIVNARRTHMTLVRAPLPELDADLWTDDAGRMLRLSIPAENLEVVREDIASVASRRITISRVNDEQVKIPANGFTLAGTVSKPSAAGPLPAVILIGGSGPTDRDEVVFNIPIFGQLAGALADAGYLVVRYDKRGVGQSGGRAESATLADFAEDVRGVVKYVAERKDVDRHRIALVGHSEGGSVAMIAAAKDKQIAALVLVATTGMTGAELNLAQVEHALDHAKKPEADRQRTIDLQKSVQKAVLTGSGWENIPPGIRKQADTPWFQSFLAFDPAKVMPEIRQPVLIVQGELDTQVDPSNADKLDTLARARKKAAPVSAVKLPGINHLLVPAKTGEYDEYRTLADRQVSPSVSSAIVSWLQTTLAARPK